MLLGLKSRLSSMNVVLASSSPRRKELLASCGIPCSILSATVDENLPLDSFGSLGDYVEAIARCKADNAAKILKASDRPDKSFDVLISADTLISFMGQPIGKPQDANDAIRILNSLSGKEHQVLTGVCLYFKPRSAEKPLIHSFHEITTVKMCQLDSETVRAYVASGEPLDKAGAYGIQGLGCSLIEKIDGDYFNIVGLPVHRVCAAIRSFLLDQANLV